jgi:hyperosmotically inducible periplasmic protein
MTTFRLGALLCLSGLAACSQNSVETAKDPTYVDKSTDTSTDPALQALAPENTATTPPPNRANPDARTPLIADIKGSNANDSADPPKASTDAPKTAEATNPGVAPDNTRVNKRDMNSSALTPMDQNNNQTDLKITQQIRQAVMADGSLSFTAKNVKIITQNGKVTLRGPVNSAQERSAIEAAARKVAGAEQVDNQLEVKK